MKADKNMSQTAAGMADDGAGSEGERQDGPVHRAPKEFESWELIQGYRLVYQLSLLQPNLMLARELSNSLTGHRPNSSGATSGGRTTCRVCEHA